MWMTYYIIEVKKKLKTQYKFTPDRIVAGEPIFKAGQIPDGEYPMEIEGKMDKVRIKNGKMSVCNYQ